MNALFILLLSRCTWTSASSSSRLASACRPVKSMRSSMPGDNRAASARSTTGSVLTKVTNRIGSAERSARWAARCSPTTVLPVPAGPRTRAGPLQLVDTSRSWSGCRNVIQLSIGPASADSRIDWVSCSTSKSTSGSGVTIVRGTTRRRRSARTAVGCSATSYAGNVASSRSATSSTWSGSSRIPRRVSQFATLRSPTRCTPCASLVTSRPAKTITGQSAWLVRPRDATVSCTRWVRLSSLPASSSRHSSSQKMLSPATCRARHALTSTMPTPPGPMSRKSTFARLDPAQRRSARTRQPSTSRAVSRLPTLASVRLARA